VLSVVSELVLIVAVTVGVAVLVILTVVVVIIVLRSAAGSVSRQPSRTLTFSHPVFI